MGDISNDMVSVHLKHDVICAGHLLMYVSTYILIRTTYSIIIFYERGVPGEMYSTTVIQNLMLRVYSGILDTRIYFTEFSESSTGTENKLRVFSSEYSKTF